MTTAREVINSLTGFEEDKVLAVTGMTIDSLATTHRRPDGSTLSFDLKLTRSLAMILTLRNTPDMTPGVAWEKVQGMSQTELGTVFEDEPDDLMPDEPDSEVGKDFSSTDEPRTTSPASVSPPE